MFLTVSSFALVALLILAACYTYRLRSEYFGGRANVQVGEQDNILLAEGQNSSMTEGENSSVSAVPRDMKDEAWLLPTISPDENTTTETSTTSTSTTTTFATEMLWLREHGALYAQCCKILTNYRVVPGVDWGIVTKGLQGFYIDNKCDDIVGRGDDFNATMCEQATNVSQCCRVATDYRIAPGKDWGWAKPDLQNWWKAQGCDNVVGTKDGFKADMCNHVADEMTKAEGGKSLGMCLPRFIEPPKPTWALQHNGVALEETCFLREGPFHAFIIGDWGGMYGASGIVAAKHLSHRMERGQGFVYPIDDHPQLLVRDQMVGRAKWANPDYILNVGDNFYWSGIEDWCGAKDFTKPYSNGGTGVDKVNQFQVFFEEVYNGQGLDGKQWLGVLGNHDFGGWLFTHAWDQMIGYTWNYATPQRWMTPALYWRTTVRYPDFSVDYYFLDTNVWDALDPHNYSPHNICGVQHNPGNSKCPGGLDSVWSCPGWFKNLWQKQKDWLEEVVPESTADWRIVVTHFPPYFGKHDWKWMAEKHQFDLIIAGHRHSQFARQVGDKSTLIWPDWGSNAFKAGYTDFLDPVSWVVSGGGGGVTSEHAPSYDGNDDQYGFMDLTLEKDRLRIEAITHSGAVRRTIYVDHVFNHTTLTSTSSTSSTITGSTTTTTTSTTSTTYDLFRWIEWKFKGPL